MSIAPAVSDFVLALQRLPRMPSVFNPWRDVDPDSDLDAKSPEVRAEQLQQYLSERAGRARIILCAEALGFQGGHFSGIAMTSERLVLGHFAKEGIAASDVIIGGGRRTSRVTTKAWSKKGFTEPTATMVWGTIRDAGIDTRDVVLWNAFPLHPMTGPDNWLTNRTPTKPELASCRPVLEQFFDLFSGASLVAVGGVAAESFGELGIQADAQVRHPIRGGAPDFRSGMARYFSTWREKQVEAL